MKSEEIIQFLKSEPMKFTYAEIEQIMDDEIEKDPSEMDTDLIDLCAEVLCNALDAHKENELNTNSKNNKRIKLKLIKIVAIAVLVALILGITVTASAKYVYNDTSDKIVKFYEDHFSINLRGTDSNDAHLNSSADLIANLKDSGFDKVMLPSVLLAEDYTYTIDVVEDNEFITAYIDFENNNNIEIRSTITKHQKDINYLFDNDMQITAEYDSAKQITLNGMDVFIFGNTKNAVVLYINDNISYKIDFINFNFDSAIEIAESIK